GGVELLNVLRRELHIGGRRVLLEASRALGAGDWHDVVALGQHPSERKLRRRHATLLGEFGDAVGEPEVLLQRLLLESRVGAPPVVLGQIIERADLPGEEAATEWRVRDQADAQLPERRDDLVLWIARPERILALHGGD